MKEMVLCHEYNAEAAFYSAYNSPAALLGMLAWGCDIRTI